MKPKKNVIILASDHAAVDLRGRLAEFFKKKGFSLAVFGPKTPESSVDYPDVVEQACKYYFSHPDECMFGILLCGTGIGVSIVANKIKGIHCALTHDIFMAECAKVHNHANFIAIGSRVKLGDDLFDIVCAFMNACEGQGRHKSRIDKIKVLEGKWVNEKL